MIPEIPRQAAEQTPAPLPLIAYAAPAPAKRRTHDVVYTALLGAVLFFQLLGALCLEFILRTPDFPAESVRIIQLIVAIELLYAAFEVIVLVIRIVAPSYGKWPTVALNVCLLPSFPFGTALAVYGLWKADRKRSL